MDDAPVTYDREKILEAIRLVDAVVVSDDRVGSRFASLSPEESYELLSKYWDEFSPFEKLARARQILSEAFDQDLGEDDMAELERELQSNTY